MTPDQKRQFARGFPVHVGVDTGKRTHVLVARGPDGLRGRPRTVPVSRDGFEEADAALREQFPGEPPDRILVGLEFAGHHGFTFAQFLGVRGYHVVNVLPLHTKRSKELEDNTPLKTDAKDAALICRLVGDGTFVRFPFLVSPYAELRILVGQHHRLCSEQIRLKNRLQGLLDLAWPEFLEHFCNLRKGTPIAVLTRWPLPADLLQERRSVLLEYVRATSRGQIRAAKMAGLLDAARRTIAMTSAPAERRLEITQLLARWALLRRQMRVVVEQVERLVAECREARILLTVPEVGPLCAAVIVSEIGVPADYEHPRQVLKLAGMNLIEQSSGMLHGRQRQSKRGRPVLRRQLYLLGGRWCLRRGLYRQEYEALLARNGGRRTKAVCSVARKLVPLLFAVMRSGEPFCAERWAAGRRGRVLQH